MQIHSTRPIDTFTVGFEDPAYDEAPHAAAVARHLGTEHHEFRMTAEDALAIIPRLPSIYDEPFADSSQIPTYLVSGAARARATVALTGDGGDELFGGYLRYFWPEQHWRRFERLPPLARRALGRTIETVPGALVDRLLRRPDGGDKAMRLARRLRTVSSGDDLYRSLVCEWYGEDPPVLSLHAKPHSKIDDIGLVQGIDSIEQRMMVWDALSYLPDDILTKVDRAAMAVSLETRVPMLDHRVAEVAWRIPFRMNFGNNGSKPALRAILDRHVSRDLIDRPKSGFGIPLGSWLRGPLRDWAESLLNESDVASAGYLDVREVRRMWTEHVLGSRDWTVRLWNILMFQAWLREAADCDVRLQRAV
jgi:asparagine synthase (glutamine-hydrolysing)